MKYDRDSCSSHFDKSVQNFNFADENLQLFSAKNRLKNTPPAVYSDRITFLTQKLIADLECLKTRLSELELQLIPDIWHFWRIQ